MQVSQQRHTHTHTLISQSVAEGDGHTGRNHESITMVKVTGGSE